MTKQRTHTKRRRGFESNRSSKAGFSLVEVMIAFTVLGIGLLSVALAQVKAIDGTQGGRHLSQASLVAQSQLEQLVRASWTDLAPVAWTAPTTINNTVQDGSLGKVEQAYGVSWRIQDVIPNETRSIDLVVTWTENDGRARSVGASTIRFNRQDL